MLSLNQHFIDQQLKKTVDEENEEGQNQMLSYLTAANISL